MWKTRTAEALVLILLGALVSGSVLAASSHGGRGWHGGHSGGWHGSFGIYLGGPRFPYYAVPYYYPPYYYPPVAAGPAYAPAYVEHGAVQAQPHANWWYYCAESQAYYPYVSQCTGPWQRVAPQPPPQ